MKNILIPTNFTDSSRNATDYALGLYNNQIDRLILLNVYQQPHFGRGIQKSLVHILEQNSTKGLEEDKLRILEKNPELENKIELVPMQGELLSSVKTVLSNEKIDIIIMGSKGDREIVDIFIESETAKVVRNVEAPILVVPPKASFGNLSRITLTTDMKKITNSHVIQEMIDLAQNNKAEINVLHVSQERSPKSSEIEMMLDQYLKEVQHDFNYIESKDIPMGIYKFITDKNSDLVTAVKRKGRGNLISRLFHQSMSRQIVRHVHQPLLLMHDLNY